MDNIKEALKVEENVPCTWASLGILDPESYFGAARTLLVSLPFHVCGKISFLREVIRKYQQPPNLPVFVTQKARSLLLELQNENSWERMLTPCRTNGSGQGLDNLLVESRTTCAPLDTP